MTDEDLNWSDARTKFSIAFGEPPGPQLEAPIIDAFEQNPQAVIKAANEVLDAYTTGNIHSPWPILRKRIERINNPLRDVTVKKPNGRAKAISRAEQWMKNAGIHFDTATEIEDELFGDRGTLKDWPDLRDRFLELWKEARPIGEQLEADLEQRYEHWKATTGVLLRYRNLEHAKQQAAKYTTDAELITETLQATTDVDLPAELQPQETT